MSFVSESLQPSFEKKISNALKADSIKYHVTFNPNKESPVKYYFFDLYFQLKNILAMNT